MVRTTTQNKSLITLTAFLLWQIYFNAEEIWKVQLPRSDVDFTVQSSNGNVSYGVKSGSFHVKQKNYELVEDFDETGHWVHRLKNPLPVSVLKVNTPIFVLTLPKGGTTSLHQYFQCGLGIGASAHHRYPYAKRQSLEKVGKTMEINVQAGKPLLSSTGIRRDKENKTIADTLDHYRIFSDFDLYDARKKRIVSMLDTLENIAQFYPNATLLYLERDPIDWVKSAKGHGALLSQWRNFKLSPLVEALFEPTSRKDFPTRKSNSSEYYALWARFFQNYGEYVRKFAKEHPSLTFVDITLNPNTHIAMEERIGIPSDCWGIANAKEGRDERRKMDKRKGGGPAALPRNWTVETYAFS